MLEFQKLCCRQKQGEVYPFLIEWLREEGGRRRKKILYIDHCRHNDSNSKNSNFTQSRKCREWLPNLLSQGLMAKMPNYLQYYLQTRSLLRITIFAEINSEYCITRFVSPDVTIPIHGKTLPLKVKKDSSYFVEA